jgi:hypothetical protein
MSKLANQAGAPKQNEIGIPAGQSGIAEEHFPYDPHDQGNLRISRLYQAQVAGARRGDLALGIARRPVASQHRNNNSIVGDGGRLGETLASIDSRSNNGDRNDNELIATLTRGVKPQTAVKIDRLFRRHRNSPRSSLRLLPRQTSEKS